MFSPVGLPSSNGSKAQHVCFVSCCPRCSSFTPLPESDRTASDLAHSHQAYRFEYPFAPFREGILSESPELQGQWSDTGPCFDSQQVILLNFIISSLPASHAGKGISEVCVLPLPSSERAGPKAFTPGHIFHAQFSRHFLSSPSVPGHHSSAFHTWHSS